MLQILQVSISLGTKANKFSAKVDNVSPLNPTASSLIPNHELVSE